MIQLTLLTGFLGSGKTTLMTNILNGYSGEKVGMIINEFGKTGVDGTLLTQDGIQMHELTGGSIFCACIKKDFLQSLIEMSKQDISYLFIEPSGLADPSEMSRILETIEPHLDKSYDYRGVVCVIDAETFPKLSTILPALPRQVEYSSAAIINKADLVDESRIVEISQLIAEMNPNCEIIVTSFCQFDARALAERIAPVDKDAQDSTNTVETRLCSYVLKPEGDIPIDKLGEFVVKLLPYAYRIKGFLPSNGGIITVNAVGEVLNIDSWVGETPPLGLVIISSVGIKIISNITEALKDGLEGKLLL